jgi:hypothetical protein
MKLTLRIFFILAIPLCLCNCGSKNPLQNAIATVWHPEFVDNGKAVDSIKAAYECPKIEYETWGEDDFNDSCLTVCLINCNKTPAAGKPDNTVAQLKQIASLIKRTLVNSNVYTSYYIIFVKREWVYWLRSDVQTAGMEIPSSEL